MKIKKASKTKARLLQEAYKLFASESYDQVTFDDLERATKLSRGAILYHIKTKENLFREVVNQYVFDRNSLKKLLEKNTEIRLWDFILALLNSYKTVKSEMKEIGIKNHNLAMYNIECSTLFIDDLAVIAKEWVAKEIDTWLHVLTNAVKNKEIKEDTDISLMAIMFENMTLGNSYHGIVLPKGQDLTILKKELTILYNMIKVEAEG